MAVSIETVVWFVLYILGAGLIFGLLMWLIGYCEREFPNSQPFPKFARIALVVLTVIVLIFIVLGLIGHPILVFK